MDAFTKKREFDREFLGEPWYEPAAMEDPRRRELQVAERLKKWHKNDPIVHAFLYHYLIGQCSYREALERCVEALAADRKRLLDLLKTKALNEPGVHIPFPEGVAHG